MLRLVLLLAVAPAALAQELPPGAFARLGGTALRHPERPLALAFRPGTSELISLGSDGTARVWDVTTGKELHVLRKKDWQANGMALSANGAFLAVHFGESRLHLYDARKKYELVASSAVVLLEGMSVTDDGTLVAGLHLGRPTLVETANGLDRMDLPDGTAVAVAPDGKSVAVANANDDEAFVEVFEVPSGKRMLRTARPFHKAPVASVAFAPDSRTFAFAADGGGPAAPVVVAQLGKADPLAKIEGVGPVAFTAADTILGRKAGKVTLWGTDGKPRGELSRDATACAATADGTTMATDSGGLFGSPCIRLWTVRTGEETALGEEPCRHFAELEAHWAAGVVVRAEGEFQWVPATGAVTPLRRSPRFSAWSKPAGFGVQASGGDKPRLQRLPPFEPKLEIDLPAVARGVAVHPKGESFAVVGREGWVRVWNAKGEELWKARTARSLRAGIAYSPDGKTLAATSIIHVALYDAATGAEAGIIGRRWDDGPFTSVAFNADGALLAVGTHGSAGAGVVYETAGRGLVQACAGANGSAIGVAFAAGTTDVLVTAHADDSLLAWRLGEPPAKPAPPEKLWDALLSADGAVAWQAVLGLVAAKEKAVPAIAAGMAAEAKPNESVRRKRAAVVLARIGTPEAKALLEGME